MMRSEFRIGPGAFATGSYIEENFDTARHYRDVWQVPPMPMNQPLVCLRSLWAAIQPQDKEPRPKSGLSSQK
ncbi:hypothetical protein AAP89_25550 [Salmonella enterica subsp. enterica]|nr:hypothetical protein [Salmonella enterica subsp. enterica serovar Typhimurium]ECH9271535.1 hypothetical protein [Salmonella enterica subsp. enterica serovar Litchfield]